ncbi:MAG: hypothetical protein WCC66_00205, partial [Rhizobiaceae bacterium]
MAKQHPKPTVGTVKYLYAHAFRCAFKGCRTELYRKDEHSGIRTLNSRVCHIKARSEGGPRWDHNQSAEDNRAHTNLVLMCVEHSNAIDDPSTALNYRDVLLEQWKSAQLKEYEQLKQSWSLDTKMAKEVIAASFSNVGVAISNSTLSLGGEGGKAPGAGGGGGGAIGEGARGGDGGGGGSITKELVDLAELVGAEFDHAEVMVGFGRVGAK